MNAEDRDYHRRERNLAIATLIVGVIAFAFAVSMIAWAWNEGVLP